MDEARRLKAVVNEPAGSKKLWVLSSWSANRQNPYDPRRIAELFDRPEAGVKQNTGHGGGLTVANLDY